MGRRGGAGSRDSAAALLAAALVGAALRGKLRPDRGFLRRGHAAPHRRSAVPVGLAPRARVSSPRRTGRPGPAQRSVPAGPHRPVHCPDRLGDLCDRFARGLSARWLLPPARAGFRSWRIPNCRFFTTEHRIGKGGSEYSAARRRPVHPFPPASGGRCQLPESLPTAEPAHSGASPGLSAQRPLRLPGRRGPCAESLAAAGIAALRAAPFRPLPTPIR